MSRNHVLFKISRTCTKGLIKCYFECWCTDCGLYLCAFFLHHHYYSVDYFTAFCSTRLPSHPGGCQVCMVSYPRKTRCETGILSEWDTCTSQGTMHAPIHSHIRTFTPWVSSSYLINLIDFSREAMWKQRECAQTLHRDHNLSSRLTQRPCAIPSAILYITYLTSNVTLDQYRSHDLILKLG